MRRLSISLLALAILSGRAVSQSTRSASSVHVERTEFNDRAMNIFGVLAQKYKVVIGVSGTLIGSDSRVVNVSLESGTLKDVLDVIVTQDTRFQWQQNSNGSIHVSIKNSPLTLLDITVPVFDAENPKRAEIVDQLSQIPETSTWLRQHECSMEEMFAGPPAREWGQFSVHLKDVPLSSVLDEIAASSRTFFWSAIKYNNRPCAINVKP